MDAAISARTTTFDNVIVHDQFLDKTLSLSILIAIKLIADSVTLDAIVMTVAGSSSLG